MQQRFSICISLTAIPLNFHELRTFRKSINTILYQNKCKGKAPLKNTSITPRVKPNNCQRFRDLYSKPPYYCQNPKVKTFFKCIFRNYSKVKGLTQGSPRTPNRLFHNKVATLHCRNNGLLFLS